METQCIQQSQELALRMGCALRCFVRDAPAVPRAHGDGGDPDFLLKVGEALESSASKVEEYIESGTHDLLGNALTCIFSNLCRHNPAFYLFRAMKPMPVELHSPLRDEVHGPVESMVRRFAQMVHSEEGGGLDNVAPEVHGKDGASCA